MANVPTARLVLRAQVREEVVYYDILSGGPESQLLKTTRFSELYDLHKAILKDLPSFEGQFPRRTLRKHMEPEFIEARRADLELYLRVAASHARISDAFQEFFISTAIGVAALPSFEASDGANRRRTSSITSNLLEEEELPFSMDASMDGKATVALLAELSKRKEDVKAAMEKKSGLERQLEVGEKRLDVQQKASTDIAAKEEKCAGLLRTHRTSLQDLQSNVTAQKSSRRDKEVEQLVAAKRLSEELSTAAAAMEAARAKVEKARQDRIAADIEAKAEIAKLEEAVLGAEQAYASAGEQKESTASIMNLLADRAKSRTAEAAAAEREKIAREKAHEEIAGRHDAAVKDCEAAEVDARTAQAKLETHLEDASSRKRAHEADIRRAKERCVAVERLRDLASRCNVDGEDTIGLEKAEKKVIEAAGLATSALKNANSQAAATTNADEAQEDNLRAMAKKTLGSVAKRRQIAETLEEYVSEKDVQLRAAQGTFAAAQAAAKVTADELTAARARHETLVRDMEDCSAALAKAKDAVKAARQKASLAQVPLRHQEDAELSVLKSREAAESSILQSLDAARTAAAEAREDVSAEPGQEEQKERDLLVANSEARVADKERLQLEATAARDTAKDALKAAREELKRCKRSLEKASRQQEELQPENAGGEAPQSPPVAQLEARVAELQRAVKEKEHTWEVAEQHAETARAELKSVEEQWQKRAVLPTSLEALLQGELAAVEELLREREERRREALEEANRSMGTWYEEKEILNADLHRASLDLAMAEEGVAATKCMHNSLAQVRR
eukprot:TRINITY_DN102072_c0_g1_i1.p1 TRINITY_DN102072_c0_g1~~TRINITY_DN102072_c0_g1_i1.p1  ORF type:complete len:796 (-),score=313.26 TRINITY_DN102072_c0_g1_i1:127-2514(-)